MSASAGMLRGHAIYLDGDVWRYADTDEPTAETHHERGCGHCGLRTGNDGHDPCLGELPGVMNACCGHGRPEDAYLQRSSGDTVSGEMARTLLAPTLGSETTGV
jgi:hypothetical protein